MAEFTARKTSGADELERREKVKHLADLMLGRKKQKPVKTHHSPQIYREELEKSVEAIIEEEAIALYRKVTGKKKIPEEGVPQEYWDRALMDVLRRWQKTLKEISETVPKVAVPPEAKFLVEAPPVCPKCGELMKKLVGNLYQCPKCFKTIRVA